MGSLGRFCKWSLSWGWILEIHGGGKTPTADALGTRVLCLVCPLDLQPASRALLLWMSPESGRKYPLLRAVLGGWGALCLPARAVRCSLLKWNGNFKEKIVQPGRQKQLCEGKNFNMLGLVDTEAYSARDFEIFKNDRGGKKWLPLVGGENTENLK